MIGRALALALATLLGVSLQASAARTVEDGAFLALLARHRLAVPEGHNQILLVTVPSWSATTGELLRLRRGRGGWQAVGPAFRAWLGDRGLGRGRGLHDGMPGSLRGAPVKREGDHRSPAGIFTLGTAFGRSARPPYSPGRWPWRIVDSDDRFVDDPSSPHYNSWQRLPSSGRPPWRSAEVLARYRLGIVIEHNADRRSGAGSAIFLHDTAGHGASVGCTMLKMADLIQVLAWLSPEARPLLVQVPGRLAPLPP